MSKTITRLTLALLAAALCARAAAQDTPAPQTPAPAPGEWVAVAPPGEEFTARMPREPLRLEQDVSVGLLAASGQRYTATADAGRVRYVVWSLTDTRHVGQRIRAKSYEGWEFAGESRYLDLVAEAAWELLGKPEVERLEAERRRTGSANPFYPTIEFHRLFELGGRQAREYAVRLEKEGGPVYVCADGARLYIVAALAPDPKSADSKRFVESFSLKALDSPLVGGGDALPAAGTAPAPGTSHVAADVVPRIDTDPLPPVPAVGGTRAESGGTFKHSEVTKKALITRKPEPRFTEPARQFNVSGVVRLRAILSKTGEVTHIRVVKYLPHGLTEQAMDAAKQIRFTPAQKDGQTVAQYVVLEYNFNIY